MATEANYKNKFLDIIGLQQLVTEIKNRFADERRTHIDMTAIEYIEDESLIPNDDIIVTLTNKGYIKRLKSDTYKTQNRGGVGIKGMTTNEEDFVERILSMSTHDYLLFFSNRGRVYRMKGYEVPEFSRQSKGLPIVNLLPLEKDENISSIVSIKQNDDNTKYLMFATKNGIVKRTAIEEFDNIRKSGKIAIVLREDDELISVKKTCGKNEIVIGASNGRMVRFDENEIRCMGRSSSGVKGIELEGAIVVGADAVVPGDMVLDAITGLPDFVTEDPEVRAQLVKWQTEWMSKFDIDYYRIDTVKHVDDTTWAAFRNALAKVNPNFKIIGEYAGAGYANDAGQLGTGLMDSLLDFLREKKITQVINMNHGILDILVLMLQLMFIIVV